MTPNEKEEWDILNHIISGNTHESVGKFLTYLQQQFAKECLWAGLGGEFAEKLVRATFAVIIKHAGLTNEFMDCVDNVDEIIDGSA